MTFLLVAVFVTFPVVWAWERVLRISGSPWPFRFLAVCVAGLATWQFVDYAAADQAEVNDRFGIGAMVSWLLVIVAAEALLLALYPPVKSLVTRYLAWEQAQSEKAR